MEQMQAAHDAEIVRHEGIEAELQRQIDDLNQTIVDLNDQLDKTQRKLSDTEGLIQGMKDKVIEAHAAMEQSLREHQARTKQIEEEYLAKEADLRDRLRITMDQLIQEQTEELNGMQGEFQNASGLMDQKFRSLNDRFIELQEMYNGRPPRPEDLSSIKEL